MITLSGWPQFARTNSGRRLWRSVRQFAGFAHPSKPQGENQKEDRIEAAHFAAGRR
jgi:hypothetical protein